MSIQYAAAERRCHHLQQTCFAIRRLFACICEQKTEDDIQVVYQTRAWRRKSFQYHAYFIGCWPLARAQFYVSKIYLWQKLQTLQFESQPCLCCSWVCRHCQIVAAYVTEWMTECEFIHGAATHTLLHTNTDDTASNRGHIRVETEFHYRPDTKWMCDTTDV